MNSCLKAISIFLFPGIILYSCNAAPEKKPGKTTVDTTAVTSTPVLKTEPVLLKDAVINEKTLIDKKRLAASKKISADDYKRLSIKMIDSTAADANGYSYHIIDTLCSKTGLNILLIGREYVSENIAWVAVYDGKFDLMDHLQVYYDNAEGFLLVETIIKNNQLSVNSRSEFEETKNNITDLYRLDENNRIVKIRDVKIHF